MLKRQNKIISGLRRAWLLMALVLTVIGSFTVFFASPPKVAANPGQPGPYGRALNYGYFFNQLHTSGDDVIPGGIFPGNIDQFIIDIRARAENWGGGWPLQHVRGAQFIVQTMRNAPGNLLPGPAEINDWEARVRSLVDNGGWINFDDPISFNINSYWQIPGEDDAFFTISSGAYVWQPWNFYDGQLVGNSIGFYDSGGNRLYAIRKACGNPVGNSFTGLPPAVPYNLVPVINAQVVGAAPGATTAEPGDTINFDFRINGTTGTPSPVVNCSIANTNRSGYYGAVIGGPAPGTSCPRAFPGNSSTVVGSQSVVATANTTVCRSLSVSPATPSGDTATTETCVIVASKPYLKVYGGDVSVGGGLATAPNTCSANNAAVIAWNKGTAGGYSGAGSQYAVQTMSGITDFASASGNVAGSAPSPTGLSFANIATNVGAGNFGGDYGSARCITDFYAKRPASTLALPANVTAMTSGNYGGAGSVSLTGGNVNPGERITVYVDGDVIITSNITFTGSWAANSIPSFQLVVRGNLFIHPSVTQLDGIYVAQANGGTGGNIYTCAVTTSPPGIFDGSFFSGCGNKLTINGAFIANSVEFDRTAGTLRNAPNPEASTSANIAEVFNFGPAFWMTQPTSSTGRVDNYDAITSLPPVL